MNGKQLFREFFSPEPELTWSDVAFGAAIVAAIGAVLFSLRSLACHHGGPCSLASAWWGEILAKLLS